MYTVQAPNDLVALDAATGRVFWTYPYSPSTQARPCCGRVNRGVAILGNTLFMGTLDGHLLAIDAKTGGLVWNTAVGGARPEAGYGFTLAPLVVKDKVIVGSVGGEFGVRGFIAAIDARTGKEAWRFNTIPGPGERGQRDVGGQFVEDRRRLDLGHRILRSRSQPDVLGRRQSGSRLEWRSPRGRQPVQRIGRRARRRHRSAEVALPVHAARRVRLRRDADSGARRHSVAGPAAQGDALGQPQRLHVRARSHERAVPARQAVREGELDRRPRREGEADEGAVADCRRHAHLPGESRRHELVFAVLQSAHRTVLHSELDGHLLHLHQAAGRIHRRTAIHRRGAGDGRSAWCSRAR